MIITGVITTIKIGGFWSQTLYNSQLNELNELYSWLILGINFIYMHLQDVEFGGRPC
jgi:hypothetical protein